MTDNVKKKTCKDCKYFGHPLWGRFYCRAREKEFYTMNIDPCWKFEQKQGSEGALTLKKEELTQKRKQDCSRCCFCDVTDDQPFCYKEESLLPLYDLEYPCKKFQLSINSFKGEYIKEIQTSMILLNQVQQLFKLQKHFEEQEESEEPLDYAKINFHCAGDFDFTVRGTDVVNFLRDYLDQEISYNLTRLEVLTDLGCSIDGNHQKVNTGKVF